MFLAAAAAVAPVSPWWQAINVAHVAITLGAAILLWIVGRLAIRTTTKSIRDGLPRPEIRRRRWRGRAASMSETRQLQDHQEAVRQRQRAGTIGTALRSTLGFVVVVVTAATVLGEVGIQIGPLLAAAGILGVALGFGAQSLVKDILSGMFILIEDQYGLGDSVDLGEASGTVEQVGLRTTRLRSIDGTVWFVPNGEIRRVGNKSRLWSRAMVEIRVHSGVDVDLAREALLDAATTALARDDIAPKVLGPATVPGAESISADAIVLRAFARVQPGQQWDVERAIRAEIQRVFRARKIRLAVGANRVFMGDDAGA